MFKKLKSHQIPLICVLLCATVVDPAMGSAPDRLFQAHEVLDITISSPLAKIKKEFDRSIAYDARLSYESSEGESVNLDIKLEVRGHYRLKKNICKFPPLKVLFEKESVKRTLFRKQKKLKLVTQCDPHPPAYADYLLKEYLAYRILNLITPNSFNVRLLRINYQDVDEPKHNKTNFGFFIEDKKRFAKRQGVKVFVEATDAVFLDSSHLNQVSLFQLLIANVDWSATSGGTGDCCHNFKLFDTGVDNNMLAVPYDFDLSGLVNAKYAIPDQGMRLRSVTQRRYRGYCRNNGLLDENIALYNQKKPEIISLVEQLSELPKKRRKSAIRFIEGFYKIVNDAKRVNRVIKTYCHKSEFKVTGD